MSQSLLIQLRQAAIELDTDLMATLIIQVRQHNEPIADALLQLVNNFQYDCLFDLIEKSIQVRHLG